MITFPTEWKNKIHVPNHQPVQNMGEKSWLVGGFNHLEKYESQWQGLSIPHI